MTAQRDLQPGLCPARIWSRRGIARLHRGLPDIPARCAPPAPTTPARWSPDRKADRHTACSESRNSSRHRCSAGSGSAPRHRGRAVPLPRLRYRPATFFKATNVCAVGSIQVAFPSRHGQPSCETSSLALIKWRNDPVRVQMLCSAPTTRSSQSTDARTLASFTPRMLAKRHRVRRHPGSVFYFAAGPEASVRELPGTHQFPGPVQRRRPIPSHAAPASRRWSAPATTPCRESSSSLHPGFGSRAETPDEIQDTVRPRQVRSADQVKALDCVPDPAPAV